MGNCGVGFAPAAPDRHDWLIELMEGVEDIPGSAMTEGITWEWESFPEYLDALERTPRVLDVGAQIAHGPLRAYVMGERGAANEPADRRRPSRPWPASSTEALRAGALGFSTSRTPLHRSKAGELVPGTDADADELLAIGDAMAAAGHGVFQFAPGPRPRARRRVAVDGGAGPAHRPHGEREPQPARPGPRGVARGARAGSTRAAARRPPDRRPGRRAARSGSSTASTAACTRCCSTPPTRRSPTSPMPERLVGPRRPERRRR